MSNKPYDFGMECPDWGALNAACLKEGVNPDWFDPDEGVFDHNTGKYLTPKTIGEYEARAKEVCQDCPMKTFEICLDYYLKVPKEQDHGVRAGRNREERLVLRRRAG